MSQPSKSPVNKFHDRSDTAARNGKLKDQKNTSEAAPRKMLDLPPWLIKRWIAHYGEATAKAMAFALSF